MAHGAWDGIDIETAVADLKKLFPGPYNFKHLSNKIATQMDIPIYFKRLPEGINSMLLSLVGGKFAIVINDAVKEEDQLCKEMLSNLAHISLSHFSGRGCLDHSVIEEEAELFCKLFTTEFGRIES